MARLDTTQGRPTILSRTHSMKARFQKMEQAFVGVKQISAQQHDAVGEFPWRRENEEHQQEKEQIGSRNQDKGKKPALRGKVGLMGCKHPGRHGPMITQTEAEPDPEDRPPMGEWNPENRQQTEQTPHHGIKGKKIGGKCNEKIGAIRQDKSAVAPHRNFFDLASAKLDKEGMGQFMGHHVNTGGKSKEQGKENPERQAAQTKTERIFKEEKARVEFSGPLPNSHRKRREQGQQDNRNEKFDCLGGQNESQVRIPIIQRAVRPHFRKKADPSHPIQLLIH